MAGGQQGRVGALDTAWSVERHPPPTTHHLLLATRHRWGPFNWCLLIWKQGICIQISRAFSGSLFSYCLVF